MSSTSTDRAGDVSASVSLVASELPLLLDEDTDCDVATPSSQKAGHSSPDDSPAIESDEGEMISIRPKVLTP